jgi:BirA family transcriptional regulator, biotin operon repressor / biotin---[acetyl-CoA-carboxylase] ligase
LKSFDVARFRALVDGRGIGLGTSATWTDSTASTNDDAQLAARSGAAHGAVFGAEAQTHGRGRRGSAWASAPGAGLWFSVLLRPELGAELVAGLALAAGLAVRAAVATRISQVPLVKWPNDVLVGSRKLSGVLVESQVAGARVAHVVVGIGVNVTQAVFPEELSRIATSLALLGAARTSREELLVDVLAELDTRIAQLSRHGFAGLVTELNEHDALRGRHLRVDGREGRGAGIDDQGRLLLEKAGEKLEAISSGHVELVVA